ncbi:hypothetical protein FRB99_002875, partial [Tulasnella sp. 403]
MLSDMLERFFQSFLPHAKQVLATAEAAATVVPLPGLAPAVHALEKLVDSLERVSIHRGRCKGLEKKARGVVDTIQTHSSQVDQTRLHNAIEAAVKAINDIADDANSWRSYSYLRSWYLRNEIGGKIQSHDTALTQCVEELQVGLATVLQIHRDVEEIKHQNDQEADRLEGRLANFEEEQRRLHETVKGLEQTLKTGTAPEQASAADELFDIRTKPVAGSLAATPAKLEGECVKLGTAPVVCGSSYDIWKGRWLGKVDVALKLCRAFGGNVLNQDRSKERFERQINLWRTLENRYVLRLYGWWQEANNIYLVSAWLERGSIIKFLEFTTPEEPFRIQAVKDILLGLQYLHSQSILHGGIQPSNILVDDDHAVLADFALAKLLETDGLVPMNTQSNPQTNSLRYQSPEISENKPITTASDVYSWAMTSLEIITSRKPDHTSKSRNLSTSLRFLGKPFYAQKSAGQLLKAMMSSSPQRDDFYSPLFDAIPGLWDLLERCWKRRPEDRPTVDEILRTLDDIIPTAFN